MKTTRQLYFALFICLGVFANPIFADITKTVGANGADFATLQLAFDDINNNIGGVYTGVVQLQIIDNTTETATAVLNASANWTAVKIYPTVSGKLISGNINNPLITLNGANNVTIDGRLYNSSSMLTGDTKDLVISNANTGTSASTIYLTANASYNTVTYTTIKGASTGSNGIIMLTVPSAVDGMANNTFSYNLITGISASVRPVYSVYARGTGSYLNKGVKIQNNEFKDFFNLGTASNAIDVDGLSDSWTISGNSFYETSSTFAPTANIAYSVIKFAGGRTHTISGNYIGGSETFANGKWTKNSTNNNNFTGILFAAGTGFTSTITNNTIKNIIWTSGTANVTWKAIDISGGGGQIILTNNTIGSATGTESIVVTNATTGSSVYGIHIQNTGNTSCSNNTIGAIKTDNAATNSTNLYGIMKSNTAGTVSINNNTLNNLSANSTATTSGNTQSLTAIMNNGGTGSITINGNNITNLVNNSTNAATGTAGSTCGIRVSAGVNTITNNIIHDLTNANANNVGTHQASVVGVAVTGSGIGVVNLTGNTIYNLSNSRSDFTGYILGIHFVGATGSVVNGNFIHSLSTNASATSAKLGGIRIYEGVCAATFSNNIINIGSNSASSVIGIAEAGTNGTGLAAGNNTNYYHNTIYIYGTTVAGSSGGYYSASTLNLRVFKNNMFINERSGGGTHYSFQTSATGLTSDYNQYYVSGTGSVLAKISADKTDLTALQSATGGDQNSIVPLSSPFNSPDITAESFLPNAESLGVQLNNATPAVTTDFMGYTRPDAPQLGALEVPVIWSGTAWNGSNSATKTAIIDGNYTGTGFTCLDLVVNAGKQTSITSGTLAVGGNMTLKSDATNGTATFIDNGGALSVGANKTYVEQYLTSGRNWYIASPVSAATSNVFAASATNPMYYYVETTPNVWSQITNTSTNLDAKKGYITNINSDRVVTFNGGSLNTGTQTISDLTSGGASFTGFYLVGNPYPSYLNWSTTTKTNVSSSIWYRSKSTGAYLFQTYNVSGVGIGTNGGTNLIPPMQAFWVKVTSATGSISLTNDDRTHVDQSVLTNRLKTPVLDSRIIVRLQVSNSINSDETVIYTDNEASNSLDRFDSNKMFNNDTSVPEVYTSLGTEKLAINGYKCLTDNQVIPLGFKSNKTDTFSIKAIELKNMPANAKLILVDMLQDNTEFDLTTGEEYSFVSDEVNSNTRFSVIYKVSDTTNDLNKSQSINSQVFVSKNSNNQIVINCTETNSKEGFISVCNAVGQNVFSTQTTGTNTIINKCFNPGAYIVAVVVSGNRTTKRIILNY